MGSERAHGRDPSAFTAGGTLGSWRLCGSWPPSLQDGVIKHAADAASQEGGSPRSGVVVPGLKVL